ncbi:type I restriction-modification system subunit M N-terminal domain-containing protein [Streptomyces hirsutus]|uniref:type I restriction-modification system subunit M N-terminal domain-containing protein n=1 Tax=Streptomyces hirsutus TaxID=35620 RepID=UPI00332E1B96
MTITQHELESRLWDAANALRGPVDPADFKTYVFPMLFWKWISDTWVYEHDAAFDEYGDDLDDEIEADFHRFELPEGTLWSEVTEKATNLGAEIAKAFQRIEMANPRSPASSATPRGATRSASRSRLCWGSFKRSTRSGSTRRRFRTTCSARVTSTC